MNKYSIHNDIVYAPISVPSEAGLIPVINQIIIDGIFNMIVNGYTDAAFNKLKQDFSNAGGDRIIAQYQAWYDNR